MLVDGPASVVGVIRSIRIRDPFAREDIARALFILTHVDITCIGVCVLQNRVVEDADEADEDEREG